MFNKPTSGKVDFSKFKKTSASSSSKKSAIGEPFGAPQTTTQFGFQAADWNTSIFGQASTSTATGAGFFGQQNPTNSSIFGGTVAGGSGGTAIAKYQPSIGRDETLRKKGKKYNTTNKFHCITMMTEFNKKSIEELRLEDYVVQMEQPDDEMRARIDQLEAYCKFLTKENSILRAQIAKCKGFRTSIHALGHCLDGITIFPPVPSPLLTDTADQLPLQAEKLKTDADLSNNTPGSLPVVPKRSVNFPNPPPGSLPLHHTVIGQAENVDSLPTVSVNRWLFVTRFARSVTEDQISDYMAQRLSSGRRPVCIGLTQPQDHPLKPASFKIELPPGEFEEALSPNFWDKGVLASEYRPPVSRNISWRNSATE